MIEVLGIEHDEAARLAVRADELTGVVAERLDVALAQRTPIT
jgi:hypothetical protein